MNTEDINLAPVVAEVWAAFERYEAALLANDVAVLNDFFWPSEHTVRYGLQEHGHGIDRICWQRDRLVPVHRERRLESVLVSTFGRDCAAVCAEFTAPDISGLGRQTQTWVRFAAGWKIVAAHVSAVDAGVLR